ncbi:hypothetical protein HQ45_03050 [Porphyromonas crevioricanis]|uniref:Uncharacterized protein n=1 Tax=Porphyromonas crevioricanis TaxID=393921 RepID=A0A0A2FHH7_9PORP|nr:hypothetical protein HQ45_03050 [Porphyromonas crevioricanis]KGN96764.1 hypothetical protein HQ38_00300 [Porphyromonas crevioricanis]SKA04917.1 hypothetical protein SAMN02745203_01711 [Porphyromonas crevioricanis]SQH73771.1 Uncharacterised protein [Porphyromonas crevioricanis]
MDIVATFEGPTGLNIGIVYFVFDTLSSFDRFWLDKKGVNKCFSHQRHYAMSNKSFPLRENIELLHDMCTKQSDILLRNTDFISVHVFSMDPYLSKE